MGVFESLKISHVIAEPDQVELHAQFGQDLGFKGRLRILLE